MLSSKKEPIILFIGDIVVFFVSLWLMLLIRYAEIPSAGTLNEHIAPFSLLFIVGLFVFFIYGLYEKQTLFLKDKLPTTVFNAQVTNSVIAFLFFYLIPYFGITPKTNLFIYLIISFVILSAWRNYGADFILGEGKKQKGLIIGSGEDVDELEKEINHNKKYNIEIIGLIDPDKIKGEDIQNKILELMEKTKISIVLVDMQNKKLESMLPSFYNLIFSSSIKFIDLYEVYEEIFNRIPISLIKHNWFLENLSKSPQVAYDILKRFMDILVSLILGCISLIFYPFTMLAIKMEDDGSIFICQTRIGKNNKKINIRKFRTMEGDDDGAKCLATARKNKITKTGAFLRKTRIDELPQFWNILNGDLSLIGPRPEMPSLAKEYENNVPYYNARHMIKPGLSGWAQLYQSTPPKFQTETDSTKIKLSYDLYYIKNRSVLLDLKIALKTIKVLLSRSGV